MDLNKVRKVGEILRQRGAVSLVTILPAPPELFTLKNPRSPKKDPDRIRYSGCIRELLLGKEGPTILAIFAYMRRSLLAGEVRTRWTIAEYGVNDAGPYRITKHRISEKSSQWKLISTDIISPEELACYAKNPQKFYGELVLFIERSAEEILSIEKNAEG